MLDKVFFLKRKKEKKHEKSNLAPPPILRDNMSKKNTITQ